MDWKKLSLSDIRRLVATIERANHNPDVVRAIIDQTPTETMPHGRVTLETLINLLEQLGGTTVLPEEVLALLRQPEPTPPPTGPVIDCDAVPPSHFGSGSWLHNKRGQTAWDLQRIDLLIPGDKPVGELLKETANQPTMNFAALEYLKTHQELLPTHWRGFRLFFCGSIYTDEQGNRYVPHLYYDYDFSRWEWGNIPVNGYSFHHGDAVLRYNALPKPMPAPTRQSTGPVINCDGEPPMLPNMPVLRHIKRGQIVWDPRHVRLNNPPTGFTGYQLESILVNQSTMNACALSYLRDRPELIPKEWQDKNLFFWGTVYRAPIGVSGTYVPYLKYDPLGGWRHQQRLLSEVGEENDVILLYSSTEPTLAAPAPPPQSTFAELIAACRFETINNARINENNFPLTDDGITGPIEEITLENVTGQEALAYIQNHGYRPVGMRRGLEYIAQHREEIVQHHKQIAILGPIIGVSSPVAMHGPFSIETFSVVCKYHGIFHYLVARE